MGRDVREDRSAALARRFAAVLSSPAGVLVAAESYAAGLMAQGRGYGGIAEPTTLLPVAGAAWLNGHRRPRAPRLPVRTVGGDR